MAEFSCDGIKIHVGCCKGLSIHLCILSDRYLIMYMYTVVRDIFTSLKFRYFEENLTSIKFFDFYFRGHMLHEASPIYARGI